MGEVGVRGDGACADAPGDAPVAAPAAGRRAGAVPVKRGAGGCGRGRPKPRRRGVVVAGRETKQAKADGVGVGRCGRKGVPDLTVRGPVDGLVPVDRTPSEVEEEEEGWCNQHGFGGAGAVPR